MWQDDVKVNAAKQDGAAPGERTVVAKPSETDKTDGSGGWQGWSADKIVSVLAVVLLLVCAIAYVKIPRSTSSALPLRIHITRMDLENLPIELSTVISCGCWTGPRNQATKKFKFGLKNNGSYPVKIGGGTDSAVRLIIAYPNSFEPEPTLPVSSNSRQVSVENPPDQYMWVADGIEPADATLLTDNGELFGTPDDYQIWALPPNPNIVVELHSDGASYGTVVDQEVLQPGEEYFSTAIGHGNWVFLTPLDDGLAAFFPGGPVEMILPTEQLVDHMIIVGIGIFSPYEDRELIGFAPAPPMSAVVDPSAF